MKIVYWPDALFSTENVMKQILRINKIPTNNSMTCSEMNEKLKPYFRNSLTELCISEFFPFGPTLNALHFWFAFAMLIQFLRIIQELEISAIGTQNKVTYQAELTVWQLCNSTLNNDKKFLINFQCFHFLNILNSAVFRFVVVRFYMYLIKSCNDLFIKQFCSPSLSHLFYVHNFEHYIYIFICYLYNDCGDINSLLLQNSYIYLKNEIYILSLFVLYR